MNAAVDNVLGRALTNVAYYMVPNVDWKVSVPLHIVDYGVELDFEGESVSFVWEDGSHRLLTINEPLEGRYPSSERSSIVSCPWDDVIGLPEQQEHQWVGQLEFEREARVWVAAASYFDGENFLIPCSDEIVVAWSTEVATSYGLLVLHN